MARKNAKQYQDSVKSNVDEARKPAQTAYRTTSSRPAVNADGREKLLKERFTPSVQKYFKETFGLDLKDRQFDAPFLHDLSEGRATRPVEMVVTPQVYDKDAKARVDLKPVKVVASLVVSLPVDPKTRKPAEIGKDSAVFVSTIPCYDYVSRAGAKTSQQEAVPERKAGAREQVVFTDREKMALEGIGISSNRLFAHQYNSLPFSVKEDIKAGREFEVTGTMRIRDSFNPERPLTVNVSGFAKMIGESVDFMPQYPVEKGPNSVLDIQRARIVGQYELDLFERNPITRGFLTDADGAPILNQAGKDLVKYGYTFGPVTAHVHSLAYDKTEKKFIDTVQTKKVMAAEKNGAIFIRPMKQVPVLDKDGNQMTVTIDGKQMPKFTYEAPVMGLTSGETTVRSFGKSYEAESARAIDDYRRGRGAKFPGYQGTDPKTKEAVTYDAFAIPDILRAGNPKFFTEKTSAELIARREEKQGHRKTQNYSMGL